MSRIENETPILPDVIADAVVRETLLYIGDHRSKFPSRPRAEAERALNDPELPAGLAGRAEIVYGKHEHFRKHIKSANGRDYLYAFMRHWLAADVKRNWPDVYAEMPREWGLGRPLFD
jgi:hypothetical protein